MLRFMKGIEEKYMRRALDLARHGEGHTSPNPMVGAVLVAEDGRIIGEGYHRRCGEAHAEVNAIKSVKDEDRHLIGSSTLYVTLEPCSHYGKTPPCAKLVIDSGIPRVVISCGDPFKEVSGRGVRMLREAGVEVVEGVLADEGRRLNEKFITAHEQHRPYVTLKWAQSSDGFTDCDRTDGKAYRFSDSLNTMLVHRLRSLHDGILVGSNTALCDNPQLNCRLWPGRSPRPIVADGRNRVDVSKLRMDNPLIVSNTRNISELLKQLYEKGFTSILVEGGPTLLKSFIESGLWNQARVEISPVELGNKGRAKAPVINRRPELIERIGKNRVEWYFS